MSSELIRNWLRRSVWTSREGADIDCGARPGSISRTTGNSSAVDRGSTAGGGWSSPIRVVSSSTPLVMVVVVVGRLLILSLLLSVVVVVADDGAGPVRMVVELPSTDVVEVESPGRLMVVGTATVVVVSSVGTVGTVGTVIVGRVEVVVVVVDGSVTSISTSSTPQEAPRARPEEEKRMSTTPPTGRMEVNVPSVGAACVASCFQAPPFTEASTRTGSVVNGGVGYLSRYSREADSAASRGDRPAGTQLLGEADEGGAGETLAGAEGSALHLNATVPGSIVFAHFDPGPVPRQVSGRPVVSPVGEVVGSHGTRSHGRGDDHSERQGDSHRQAQDPSHRAAISTSAPVATLSIGRDGRVSSKIVSLAVRR